MKLAERLRANALPLAGLLLVIASVEAAAIGLAWFRDPERARSASPVLRGARVAERMGCFSCHGPGGVTGVPNPRSKFGDVPAWVGGNYMMYNESPDEIREWILDGAPRRLLDDPADIERRGRQLISMPMFRGRLSQGDLADLVAYVQSVSGAVAAPEGPAAEGRSLAVEHGCFGCHGPEGRGLLRNPGSLKGFIPPWDSNDYRELVANPEEFREWVAHGEIRRFRDNPAAAHFLDAQTIKMPAFEGVLSVPEIDKLHAYVEWLRSRP